MKHLGWDWIEQDAMGGASASSIIKLGKHLRINSTEQVAREVIQNSWDAAQEFRKLDGHKFSMTFRFVEYSRAEADALRTAFATDDLETPFREHFQLDEARASLVLGKGPVRALIVEDFGAHGLYGHPTRLKNESIMHRALYKVGSTGKDTNDLMSGGSYGFGKSAFISASASNLVIAYSCFRPYKDDPVTSRLVGWTWQDEFEMDGKDLQGRAVFGQFFNEDSGSKAAVEPYEDSKANSLAQLLGLSKRQPEQLNQLGTSLVLFDPVVNPEDLKSAIETFWWPAVIDPEIHLSIEVVDFDGSYVHPQPRSRKDLQPLIRAYELATQKSDASLGVQEKVVRLKNLEGFENIGSIGLVAEFPEDGSSLRFPPKALLIRGPRMVIGELEHSFQNKPVAIYGVFATDAKAFAVDRALRSTEPYTHDRWDRSPGVTVESKRIASLVSKIQETFSREVNDFARNMAQEVPVSPKKLVGFSKIFGKFFGDSKGQPPEVAGEALPISIHFGNKVLEATDDGRIKLSQVVDVARVQSDELEIKAANLRICPELKVILDESQRGDTISFTLLDDKGKKLAAGTSGFELTFDIQEKIRFKVQSDPYDSSWTTDLVIRVEVVD
jgi:hypothetical protein